MKIAIVGSRDWPVNPQKIWRYIDRLDPGVDVILSGAARGVDSIAAAYGRKNNFRVMEFKADWDNLGRGAGYIRNEALVAAADKVVAFWDGESKGTKHSIDLALEAHKSLEVIFP